MLAGAFLMGLGSYGAHSERGDIWQLAADPPIMPSVPAAVRRNRLTGQIDDTRLIDRRCRLFTHHVQPVI
ncbi:hypothetical protein PhaeoP97_01812 [Phaeobacter porticola]|uniref:Uncharacterized protein n=1 Tax=Phaeobacter porticola TaxID=1844006 RepID=A0A1L3I541_9RHOB|nr:hypothetical protein PhaeoP97_01812 [Phaeobacter porticola]